MSRDKRRRKDASGPPSSAGLLSFYGEATDSLIKIRPEIVFLITVALIIGVILATAFLKL